MYLNLLTRQGKKAWVLKLLDDTQIKLLIETLLSENGHRVAFAFWDRVREFLHLDWEAASALKFGWQVKLELT